MKRRIKTCDEFINELHRVRFAAEHWSDLFASDSRHPPSRPYGLWKALLTLVEQAIAERDWPAVAELLRLYDDVQRAGPRSEMAEGFNVSFVEAFRFPEDPADLRQLWQQHGCPH